MDRIMLIVEPEKAERETLCEIFRERYEIETVESTAAALAVLEKKSADIGVILLEMDFAEDTAFTFLEQKQQNEHYRKIPLVMVAAADALEAQERGLEMGANELITRPVLPRSAKLRVESVCGQNQYVKAIEKKMEILEMQAELDEMTGLLNRFSTEMKINNVLKDSDGVLDVMMIIDIDYFKTVNDTLGHQVGDKVIKIISDLICRCTRQTDIVGRVGGDEFCVLLRDVPNMEIAYSKLRELNQMMKYKPNLAIPEYVSLSIGVASNECRSTTYAALFKKADEALYLAKEGGRAQYREYGVEPQNEVLQGKPVQAADAGNVVLVVEDDPISRQMLCRALQDGYTVLEAENGIEAMKLMHAHEDDLMTVLLDLNMPIMDGFQVLEQMKRDNSLKSIPTVISTADNSEISDLKLLNLGVSIITHKPTNSALTRKQVDNLVANYHEMKNEVKQHMLQKTLIGNRANTFLCSYYFKTGKAEIGENYLKYVGSDFPEMFKSYPFAVADFVLPDDCGRVQEFFDVTHENEDHGNIEVRLRVDQAYYEWFEISKVVNYDEKHEPDSVIFMFLNIQYAVDAKQDLMFMAANDVLTQIPNLRTFNREVPEMLEQHPDEKFDMLTMDIFQFRIVNQLFGYKEGDNVIKYVATKLREIVGEYELGACCRVSSDIFCICMPERENIGEFMQMMQQAMSMYPLKLQLKLCFGIYRIADHHETVESMIEHSTFARKKTKEAPLKTFQYYDENLQKKETFELVAIAEMEEALKTRQFEVYYQPKCDINTGEIVGAEALIRWHHPKEGYLSPAYFIPIFEKNGTCVELDYYVYEQVCRTVRQCLDEGKPIVPVSVNVSRWSLYNKELQRNILNIVEKYRIPHKYIEFEITESAFVLETNLLTSFSKQMRENGFRILIDDFGSGYSSLNSLKDILVDVLKIDIKFLPVSKTERKAEIVLSSVINMGQQLGLDVIAEGVETIEQVELLKTLGCRCVQGYYFYRPMPCKDFRNLLER